MVSKMPGCMKFINANRTSREIRGVERLMKILGKLIWAQRDDPHWFGARIPDAPQSIEFVQIVAPGQISFYRRFDGAALTEDSAASAIASQRTSFIVGLPPAPLP